MISLNPNNFKVLKPQKTRAFQKRFVRYGLVLANLVIVVIAVFVVMYNRGGNAANYVVLNSVEEAKHSDPLDTITATDVAAEVARMTRLPEADAIVNDADIARANISSATQLSQSDTVLLPQVISGNIKTKADIIRYKAKKGDTFTTLSEEFGVTSDSIRWSNGITEVKPGQNLLIPPVNGIAYKVKKGDTAKNLAEKYNVNASVITRFNDAEVSGLKRNELIVIPNGTIRVATVRYAGYGYVGSAYSPTYGGNGYIYGYCTWYVASRIRVPTNWHNANTWDDYARQTDGWVVNNTPRAGSILQDDGVLYGIYHVAYVESVNSDGSVNISEMNAPRWGVRTTRTWSAAQLRAAGAEFIHKR